ncbi:MAG: hypothetical protein WD431_21470 [Cyclobacteriaceae bacterium]
MDKGKKLIELIKKVLQSVEGDNLIQAGMHIRHMEIEGLKLDLRGQPIIFTATNPNSMELLIVFKLLWFKMIT